MADLDVLREKMWDDLTVLCKQWQAEGIQPVYIAVRLLVMSISVAEYAGVTQEQLNGIVGKFYNPQPVVPKAKA